MMVLLALLAAGYAPDPLATVRALVGEGEARVAMARADLNGDGRAEAIAYVEGPTVCGSGGCNVAVLTPTARGWRLIGGISVARRPLRLLDTRTAGWRDLGVTIGGGGGRSGLAQVRFGRGRYRGNPTLAAPVPVGSGRVLIAADAPLAPLP